MERTQLVLLRSVFPIGGSRSPEALTSTDGVKPSTEALVPSSYQATHGDGAVFAALGDILASSGVVSSPHYLPY